MSPRNDDIPFETGHRAVVCHLAHATHELRLILRIDGLLLASTPRALVLILDLDRN